MIRMDTRTLSGVFISLCLSSVTALTSCYQKELCYTHPHTKGVGVVFDWRNAPSAHPASMSLYMVPHDGGFPSRYEFAGRDGGGMELSPGSYDALCINGDGPRNYFRNTESRESFEVYTMEVKALEGVDELVAKLPRAKGAGEEPVVHEPDSVWCDVTQSPFVLPPGADVGNASHTLTLYPRPLFRTCTVEIRDVQNLQYVRGSLSATLSGLSGGVLASSGTPTDDHVTVPFGLRPHGTTALVGRFRTFGYSPRKQSSHKLVVYAVLKDGSRRFFTYDVTDQVRNATDPLHIRIVLEKLTLPVSISSGGGFKATLSEWKDGGTIEVKL